MLILAFLFPTTNAFRFLTLWLKGYLRRAVVASYCWGELTVLSNSLFKSAFLDHHMAWWSHNFLIDRYPPFLSFKSFFSFASFFFHVYFLSRLFSFAFFFYPFLFLICCIFFNFASFWGFLNGLPNGFPLIIDSCPSPSDSLISLSYSMAAFSANSFILF